MIVLNISMLRKKLYFSKTKFNGLKKYLYFVITIIFTLFYSNNTNAQCDFVYYANNPGDTCLEMGDDITISTPTTSIIQVFDTNGFMMESANFVTSLVWQNVPDGEYIIKIIDASTFIPCTNSIIIAQGPVSLPNTTLFYCQWNTISIADTISTYFLQNGTNPQYTFTDTAGNPINGPAYYINNSGVTLIDVTVVDASGCTTSEQITIDAQANDINTQNYTISDTVVQFCSDTDIDFFIDNPDTNFTYNWTIDGQPFYNTPTCQYTFSAISNYQGPVIFEI